MSRIETTVALPEGWAFAQLHTGLDLSSQSSTNVSYDEAEDTVGLHLGKVYLSFTRAQWLAIVRAAADVMVPQVVTA